MLPGFHGGTEVLCGSECCPQVYTGIHGMATHSVVLPSSSVVFDAFYDICLAALVCGKTVVVEPDLHLALEMQPRLSLVFMVPSVAAALDPSLYEKVDMMLLGGEALPTPLVEQLCQLGIRLGNIYGPTEATVWCTSGGTMAQGVWHCCSQLPCLSAGESSCMLGSKCFCNP